MGVTTIDCIYLDYGIAASYLLRDRTHALFVDNNTAKALPRLLMALRSEGMTPDQVEFLVVTHVHLDHAAGTAALAEACPNAVVLCHPRAAPHLVDPSKLVSSARQVYGDAAFEQLYAGIGPVPASRVRAVEDGEVVEFGRHRLRALHTRGHANHHICVFDEVEGDIFTGDAFGLCYPALQRSGLCIFPSTSPTDFEPEEAIRSVQRIVATGARRAFPTHFGAVPEIRAAAEQMEAHLRNAGRTLDEAVRSGVPDGELNAWCIQRVRADFQAEMDKRGLPYGPKEQNLLRLDLDLNGAGIAHVARKRRQKSAAH